MTDSETLNQMRDRWGHQWRVWRSTKTRHLTNGDSEQVPNGWNATRLDPDAGPDATVMCDTATALDAELLRYSSPASDSPGPLAVAVNTDK